MEKLCNSSMCSRQFPTRDKLLYAQKSFVRFIELRKRYWCMTTGKKTGTEKKGWHLTLVDSDKLDQYLDKAKTGHVNVIHYGSVLISGLEDPPKELNESIFALLSNEFVITLNPESNDEILYVLADPGKKQEVFEARSLEDINCHGTILYTANFLEPPESVSFNILKRLCLLKANRVNVESTRIETNQNILEMNCTDENGSTLLHQVSFCGNKSIVRNVVRKGADIFKKDEVSGRLPVHIAALKGDIGVLEFYLNNEINVNVTDGNGWSLLHNAVWNNNLEAIRFLIRSYSKINMKDKCLGKTALHVGADQGHPEAVQILLENDAKIDEVDDCNRTALYYSAMAGCLETTKLLIKRGASIHIANKYGVKPLATAVTVEGNKDMVEFLLSVGSHIDNQDSEGYTALHYAANLGYLDIVHLLVNQGAEVNIVGINGETPFDYGKNHMDVASYLAFKMIKIYLSESNIENAYKVSKDLLKIHGEILAADQIETIDAIFNVARLLYQEGQYSKAFDILKNMNVYLSNDYVTLRAKCELHFSLIEVQVKYKDAVEGIRGVFEKWESNLSNDQSDSLTIACNSAREHFNKCEYDETLNVLRNAL